MTNHRIVGFFVAAVFALTISGCSSSSHVLVGKQRSEISPETVKIYLKPPAEFEQIAILDASSKGSFAITDQGKMNKAIERLKEEAAKLGANGILLQSSGNQFGGTVMTGSATASGNTAFGTGVGVPIILKTASGIAIYVTKE